MKYNTYIEEVPVYVPGVTTEELGKSHGIPKEEIVKLSSNENPLGPSPVAAEAVKNEIQVLNIYPDNTYSELKMALSQKIGVKPENIAVGNGSSEIFLFLSLAFLNENCTLVTSRHTFQIYKISGKIVGSKVIQVPMRKGLKIDLEGILSSITRDTSIVYICNPNNPTGSYLTKEEVEYFLEQVPEDILVVFDEAYYEYVTASDYPETINYIDYGNVVIIRTFSKIYGLAGLRLGYAITSPEIIEKFEHVRFPFSVSRPAVVAGIAALQDTLHVQRSRASNERNKFKMYKKFDELGVKYISSQGNFIYLETKIRGKRLFEMLLNYGIIVRPLDAYELPMGIRVTIGNDHETERFLSALEDVIRKWDTINSREED